MAVWVDPTDPLVVSTVVTGCPDSSYVVPNPPDDTVELSIQLASEMLTRLTGFLIHPGGEAVEDFRASSRARRLSPNYRPVREILSVMRLVENCAEEPVDMAGWCVIGQSIFFSQDGCRLGDWYRDVCGCTGWNETLRVEYRFGSTVTAAARSAVLHLARQFWLDCNPGEGDCELPERVTSVNREGLSFTLIDPMTFLDRGRVGIPRIDTWLATVNPSRALRPAGVYTPDAPPPVNRSILTA